MARNILKVLIPFIEGSSSKPRPVVQLTNPSDEHNNFQVAYITSKSPKNKYQTDLLLDQNSPEFEKTGLLLSSYIRCSKIFTINSEMVDLIIGELPKNLDAKLSLVLKKHFKI